MEATTGDLYQDFMGFTLFSVTSNAHNSALFE